MYPEYILEMLRQRQGLEYDDASMDDKFNSWHPKVVFNEVCNWEGMIGYGDTIIGWVEDIFNVSL